ncbi:MAG: protein-L-isoaspartate(D-aspartate) O-methyltransferase [Candidatus Tectomicrobia bacterium]|uniref:Protein-L-isoaspartate O-methyltransferase n=1 Tax=Tectimicrobiota bacterium TaxID=2528274 RepID=A0A937VYM1_UNCTE|nr:protein-L-isoaspartate(D-aspartate) O-methyltransferase [Candidatus Tectomicrobia bacterium]
MATPHGTQQEQAYTAERLAMVRTQLQERGITDARVLQAMRTVPRHAFVPPAWRQEAYSDHPLPIAKNQTISQPYIVAMMTQSLALQEHERVLEVGTGSGYQAAVLSHLVAHVYSIEYFPVLAEQARTVLQQLGYHNIEVLTGDGSLGLPAYAPYDGIIVTAAAPHVPQSLLTQLADGARLVIPVGSRASQALRLITRHGEHYQEQRSILCRFVPLRGEEGWHDGTRA